MIKRTRKHRPMSDGRTKLTRCALWIALFLFSGMVEPTQARASLARDGWQAIQTGSYEEAMRYFKDATILRPNDPTLFLGAGLAAHLQGQADRARVALQEALTLNPRLTEASLLSGEIA